MHRVKGNYFCFVIIKTGNKKRRMRKGEERKGRRRQQVTPLSRVTHGGHAVSLICLNSLDLVAAAFCDRRPRRLDEM